MWNWRAASKHHAKTPEHAWSHHYSKASCAYVHLDTVESFAKNKYATTSYASLMVIFLLFFPKIYNFAKNLRWVGICITKSTGGYNCKCSDGTIRENCAKHPCEMNVCGDFGACQRINSSYVCDCIPG